MGYKIPHNVPRRIYSCLLVAVAILLSNNLYAQSYITWQSAPGALTGTYPGGTVTISQTNSGNDNIYATPPSVQNNLIVTGNQTFSTFGSTNNPPSKSTTFTFSTPVIVTRYNMTDIDLSPPLWDDTFTFSDIAFTSVTATNCLATVNGAIATTDIGNGLEYASWFVSTTPVSSFTVDYSVTGGLTHAYLGYSIEVMLPPSVTLTSSSQSVCADLPTTITATPDVPSAYNYAWTIPTGANPPGNVATFPTSTPGVYSVVATHVATGIEAPETSITITSGDLITPLFNQVAPICEGGNLPTLPTVSTNGIPGSWSPAINNLASTTYTFTPTTSACASVTTMTIEVQVPQIPIFDEIPAVCEGTSTSPLPTVSSNGITGSWSPPFNNHTTTEYTFTPDSGECATSTTLTAAVEPGVIPLFSPVASICINEPASPLPTISLNGISGSWSPELDNTVTTTYTFLPLEDQCAASTTLTIEVNQITIPVFSQSPPICAGDYLNPLPSTSLNGISGNWSPAINNLATTTYTFVPDSGLCAEIAIMTLEVNPIISPLFETFNSICYGEVFELPISSINGVVGTWSPDFNNTSTTTYTFMPNANQCANPSSVEIKVIAPISYIIETECNNNLFELSIAGDILDQAGVQYIWTDESGQEIGYNDPIFNVTNYINSTSEVETLPITFNATAITEDGCSHTETIVLTNIFCDVQKGISPNNDGLNDNFDLRLLNVGQLEIYNRHGRKIYHKANYSNEWFGQDNKGASLPDGTYYYHITFKDNQSPRSGWIHILQTN